MNPFHHLPQFTLNLRWLARQVSNRPEKWAEIVAKRTESREIGVYRAQALLKGDPPDMKEIEDVLAAFDIPEMELLVSAPLYGAPPNTILNLNLQFLLESVPKGGERQALAKKLRVTPSTLSRWGKGVVKPEKKNLKALLRHFGEDDQIDLEKAPLFLMMRPVGDVQKRTWLIDRVEEMPSAELNEIFPAAERIFTRREYPER